MYNYKTDLEKAISYWEKQPTDKPYTVNGFNGKWQFSDHDLIPGELMNFLSEYFHGYVRLKRVPLEDINNALNDVWEGPGSMVKLVKLTSEMRQKRQEGRTNSKDPLAGYENPTINSDFDDNIVIDFGLDNEED